jgi:hypothetical protein
MRLRSFFASTLCSFAVAIVAAVGALGQSREIAVEVFPVPDMPLTIRELTLTQSEKGFPLKCSLTNSSEVKIVGLRYSLMEIDPVKGIRALANRTEGFSLEPYATKSLKFAVPIQQLPPDGVRLVLMLEQTISRESIWEVIKAKEVLDAYAKGDYSVVPRVVRGPTQVDVPPAIRVIH